jgi:hypothetical protein
MFWSCENKFLRNPVSGIQIIGKNRHENNCYKMRAVSAEELIYICHQSSTKIVSR